MISLFLKYKLHISIILRYILSTLLLYLQDGLYNGGLCDAKLENLEELGTRSRLTVQGYESKKDRNGAVRAFNIGLEQQSYEDSQHSTAYCILGDELLASWMLLPPHYCNTNSCSSSSGEEEDTDREEEKAARDVLAAIHDSGPGQDPISAKEQAVMEVLAVTHSLSSERVRDVIKSKKTSRQRGMMPGQVRDDMMEVSLGALYARLMEEESEDETESEKETEKKEVEKRKTLRKTQVEKKETEKGEEEKKEKDEAMEEENEEENEEEKKEKDEAMEEEGEKKEVGVTGQVLINLDHSCKSEFDEEFSASCN